MTIEKGKVEPLSGGLPGYSMPAYIRFSGEQLRLMDEAIKYVENLSRGEGVRKAVRWLFNIPVGLNEKVG